MYSFNQFILRIGRAETPFFVFIKKVIRLLLSPPLLVLPRSVLAPARLLYEVHYLMVTVWRSFKTVFYYSPLFQARCTSFGTGVTLNGLPFVTGPIEIHVGNNTLIGGDVHIFAGRIFEKPQLILKDRSSVGWGVTFTVNKEVVLEEDVIIAPNCRISDSDGHPREADLRAAGASPHAADIRPIRICRYAWIGAGTYVMKGVTIGEGAVVAANSVVMTNIPAYSLAVGNPAEVLLRNYGRPSTDPRKTKKSPPPEATAG